MKKIVNDKDKHPIFLSKRTLSQRAADLITRFAGSWVFIISFLVFMALWIFANLYLWFSKAWDPYPFILLNFVLSCLAALQAPVILMSQNRENQRDRIRAEYDYGVNRRAEREIREVQKELRAIKRLLKAKKQGF